MDLNYEEDMYIDMDNLEVEILNQSQLAMKYGKYLSECRKVHSLAEEKVKLTRSELNNKASKDPKRWIPSKNPTVGNLEAYYRSHPKHIRAKEEAIAAEFELELAQIAFNEISRTRRFALENMVKLYGLQYFAGPKVPKSLEEIAILSKRNRDLSRATANSKVRMNQSKRKRIRTRSI